ncbi:MAG: putative Ig domain-containing protein, partial [Planctomycetes bacterium]|nr:putative Ig domain-containing protein [Planctomycetota bacterium]
TATLPNGTVGLGYSQTLQATGGTAPYTWDITAGALPGGITFSTAGVLSGMPTASGTFNFTVRARDTALVAGTRPLTLIVDPSGAPGGPVIVTTSTLPNGIVGQAYSQGLSASGGQPPYTWAITLGSLPSGLTLSANGVISGTPTGAVISSFTVRATDSAASPQQGSAALMLTVDVASNGVFITTAALPSAQAGSTYSTTLVASGGTTPYSWDVTAGFLPPGLTLDQATGQISGSPGGAGVYSFSITVTDASMATNTRGLSITVSSASEGDEGGCTSGDGPGITQQLLVFALLLGLSLRVARRQRA